MLSGLPGFLGLHFLERVAGFDLMQEILTCAADECWPVFLLGAEPGIAREALNE